MNKRSLKPCPFCGEQPFYIPAGTNGDGDVIYCNNCRYEISDHHHSEGKCFEIWENRTRDRFELPKWVSIQAAPKNGTVILAYIPKNSGHRFGYEIITWNDDKKKFVDIYGATVYSTHPTHWMPLPRPPNKRR